jgi:hypothetical protein
MPDEVRGDARAVEEGALAAQSTPGKLPRRERNKEAERLGRRCQLIRGWRTWAQWAKCTSDMNAFTDVASMQFSHVVVTPQSEGGSSSGGIEYMWRSAQDWALLHACQSGHLSTVQTLVGRGAQVGVTDGLSQNALHVAAFAGHAEIVRVLLDAPGTDIDAEDTNGHTALTLASLRGHHLIMRYLAEAGSDACSTHGSTADNEATI